MSKFTPATRAQVKLKLAIAGPSGSGKTYSALLMASGIGKRIAVIDTENRSASLYADLESGPLAGVRFDVLNIFPPYTVPKYLDAIEDAQKAGYDVLIIDSISHSWAGEGGLLDKKGALDQRPNSNAYTNWAPITKEHEAFKAKILNADIHTIVTMRSKQDYILEQNDRGKSAPKKVGLAPVQREGTEYDYAVVFDLAMDHNAMASKDRTSMFDGLVFKPTKETGASLLGWLNKGAHEPKPQAKPQAKPKAAVPMTEAQSIEVMELVERFRGLTNESDERISQAIRDRIKKVHGVEVGGTADLNEVMAATLIESLKRWCEAKAKQAEAEPEGEHE